MCAKLAILDDESDDEEFHGSDENQIPDEEEEDQIIIRAKWTMDGAETIDECIQKLNTYIEYLKSLKEDGWDLREAVDDDWGFLVKIHY